MEYCPLVSYILVQIMTSEGVAIKFLRQLDTMYTLNDVKRIILDEPEVLENVQ